jgi:hypothetical protein
MSALAYVLPLMLMHASLTASPRSLPVSGAVLQGGGAIGAGSLDIGAAGAPLPLPFAGSVLRGGVGRQVWDPPSGMGGSGGGCSAPVCRVGLLLHGAVCVGS